MKHLRALLREMDLRYQQRFDAQQEALTSALLAAEKAVDKANVANEKRFESVNEFRQALTDQTRSFPSRVELDAIAGQVSDLKDRMNQTQGRSTGLSDGTKLLVQVGGLIVAVVAAALTLYIGLKG